MSVQLTTKTFLVRELRAAGVEYGDVLLVHTALSRLGFVPGAARTVIESLLGAVGQSGTIMMPTYSGELSDPAEWRHPPVPAHWVQPILDETPPYDPKLTPTRGMGVVAELFRHFPGVLRSPHPQSSFAARGPFAETLVREHPLDYRFGSRSPLGKLRDIGGKVLLLGAPPETCSLFYLTQEYMTKNVEVLRKAPLLRNDCKAWVQYRDIEYPCAWFGAACDYLCGLGIARRILIGNATSYIFPARVAVEALVTWRHGIGV